MARQGSNLITQFTLNRTWIVQIDIFLNFVFLYIKKVNTYSAGFFLLCRGLLTWTFALFWGVNSVDDLKFLVSLCCRYFNVLYFFSWPDQKLHVLPVKTNRSLHHTTLHVSRGHVNACSLWSLQPSPRPKNLTTFLLFRRGIYWTKNIFRVGFYRAGV